MSFTQALWRTSRNALKYQRGVNPVQQAWGVQGANRSVNGIRNYAAAFQRDKPHVNIGKLQCSGISHALLIEIGTIGHVDHGKACGPFSPIDPYFLT